MACSYLDSAMADISVKYDFREGLRMKQIKNPEYTKWTRELRKFSIAIGYVHEVPIFDGYTRTRPFPIGFLTNPRHCDNEQIQQWIAEHPAPPKMIDDPEFVALQEQIRVLEKENSDLKQGVGLDIHKLLLDWHEKHVALSLEDVSYIVDKLLHRMCMYGEINNTWWLSEEDEHLYTDKGLEAPCIFDGDDANYNMSMLSIYIGQFRASRHMTREQRYYKALNKDIESKLKEGKNT